MDDSDFKIVNCDITKFVNSPNRYFVLRFAVGDPFFHHHSPTEILLATARPQLIHVDTTAKNHCIYGRGQQIDGDSV